MLDRLLNKPIFYKVYIALLLLLSIVIIITGQEVYGAVLFGCIAMVALVLFSDLTVFLAPVMLLSVFVTSCYDSYSTFIKFLPLALPLALCILFNVIKYRAKILLGKSFIGLVGVALAVTLGGVGTLPVKDYFSSSSLFYVFALGGGMVLIYLWFSPRINSKTGMNIARLMYAVGVLASFSVLFYCYNNYDILFTRKFTDIYQPSNNLCTFLMLAMPFPLYFAKKRFVDVLATLVMYGSILLTGSRGGLVMGSVELVILLVCYTLFFEKKPLIKALYILITAVCVATFVNCLPTIAVRLAFYKHQTPPESPTLWESIMLLKEHIVSPNESRVRLLLRAVDDLRSNLLFGVGLGYKGNADIYSPVSGAMNWYHMWTAQIFGGLGLLGVVAYGYQLVTRWIIYFKNRSPLNMTLFLSYIGLWLMSQVNPGEFCPIPYALTAVIYFIIIERAKYGDSEADPYL
ncbi:MAG: hypothetical protein IKL05_05975 [Clostridia bacterium]|nr:hypothetical protein [Clostridia bacterium]